MGLFKNINLLLEKKACKHSWRVLKEVKVADDFAPYLKLVMVCHKCGKVKIIKL
jgi:hypothetical protein